MQYRYWDFSEIDSTEFMNDVILSIVRSRLSGLAGAGKLRPGRLGGFVPVAKGSNSIDLSRDGLDTQTVVTQDGVIVSEDADLTDPVTLGNVNSANPRIDIVAVKHTYVASLPNTQARYVTIAGDALPHPVPNYAAVSADETPIAEIYIDPAPGIGNPPVVVQANIKMLPSALDLWEADYEPTYGRTDNAMGDGGAWARMGRNADRFYLMRDPDNADQVFLVLNAYYTSGTIRRVSGADGQCSVVGTPRFTSVGSDFVTDGVKPGDQLTITIGANAGAYSVVDVLSSTVLETSPAWPAAPSVGETFYIESKDTAWHQEDITKRSALVVVTDKTGASDEMFGVYKADQAKQSNTFGSFWDNLLSLKADGVMTWPTAFSGQNAVYGCSHYRNAGASLQVGPGWVYNNGEFRVNTTAQTIDISNVYNAGTSTWGRIAGEPIADGWWYLYATVDTSGSGFGLALSQTPPATMDLYLQHPLYPDFRWIGSVCYVAAAVAFRDYLRDPGTGFVQWTDYRVDTTGGSTAGRYQILPAVAGNPVTHNLNVYDAPITSVRFNGYLRGSVASGYVQVVLTNDTVSGISTAAQNRAVAAWGESAITSSVGTTYADLYHSGDASRQVLLGRVVPGFSVFMWVYGYYEHINQPLPKSIV